jgi:MtN3 and saliva related transmembrane protein
MDFTTLIGSAAAFCTTVSYLPQLKKCWETGSAGDLSLKMFATLAAGVALWIVYGFLKADLVIIFANAVSLALLFGILYFKLTGQRSILNTSTDEPIAEQAESRP